MSALDDIAASFILTGRRGIRNDTSDFTSGTEGSTAWFWQNAEGEPVYLVQTQAPSVIRRMQQGAGLSGRDADGKFGDVTRRNIIARMVSAGMIPSTVVPSLAQIVAAGLLFGFHNGRGRVVFPPRVNLPEPSRPILAPGSSSYLSVFDVSNGRSASAGVIAPTGPAPATTHNMVPTTPTTGTTAPATTPEGARLLSQQQGVAVYEALDRSLQVLRADGGGTLRVTRTVTSTGGTQALADPTVPQDEKCAIARAMLARGERTDLPATCQAITTTGTPGTPGTTTETTTIEVTLQGKVNGSSDQSQSTKYAMGALSNLQSAAASAPASASNVGNYVVATAGVLGLGFVGYRALGGKPFLTKPERQ